MVAPKTRKGGSFILENALHDNYLLDGRLWEIWQTCLASGDATAGRFSDGGEAIETGDGWKTMRTGKIDLQNRWQKSEKD